ncbi:MAG: glycine dehydrogenase (aminomethyl-transferring), partial [Gammaproteobacteria bacterium]|nr:glycine dehydrogenase (aminomethyl-transferring) [Gammaproteobacteria bacterium]
MTPDDYPVMFDTLGVETLDALIDAVVPTAIRLQQPLQLPDALSEDQALAELHAIAQTNQVLRSCLGQGYYGTLTPAVIQRNVLENPAWYTAYTPYQPEISQGRLEALFNYQTMIVELTGLAVANASLLDEGTACAEAMTLCQRASKSKSTRCYVATNLFAQSLAVLQTRAAPLGIELIPFDPAHPPTFEDAFGLIVQYVGDTGAIVDLETLLPAAKAAGLLTVVAADPLALTLLTPPGQLGADICLGSTQRFGVPMGAGGPHAAFFAVADGLKRMIPGRLVGQSIDAQGRPAYRLTLQTREQHIRREKATSNICTAQVLLANIAGFYGCYHGPDGLIAIAERVHRFTGQLAQALLDAGLTINLTFFDTLTVAVP